MLRLEGRLSLRVTQIELPGEEDAKKDVSYDPINFKSNSVIYSVDACREDKIYFAVDK